jgi:hypothetical protein
MRDLPGFGRAVGGRTGRRPAAHGRIIMQARGKIAYQVNGCTIF